jgi:hypothetical protein
VPDAAAVPEDEPEAEEDPEEPEDPEEEAVPEEADTSVLLLIDTSLIVPDAEELI